MCTSRRAFLWIAILGLAITLVVILQRRSDDPAVQEAAASAPQSIDATRTTQGVAPADESAELIAGSGDEAVTKCTQTINDAADFASMERNAASPVQARESDDDELLAELGKAQRSLAGSRDPEHLLAALLLDSPERRAANDASAQTKLLDLGDHAAKSGSKLMAWHALSACVAAKQSCPMAHLEQRLLEVDKQNAETWVLVATLKYERGDVAGALAAMQGAARAPASTWYWTETVALFERSLAAHSSMLYPDRLASAFGTGASLASPSQSNLLKMCKVESASSRAWGEACLAFGTLRGKRNETLLAQLIAYSLREQALTALGDREGAAEVAAERAYVDAERNSLGQEPAMSMTKLQWELIQTDPAQLHTYLGAIQQFGEIAGPRMYLWQELPPLLERAGLLERDGAQECVAQFFFGSRRATVGQRAQVADELHLSMRSPSGGGQRTLRIRPDGRITVPFVRGTRTAEGTMVRPAREIVAAGKTTDQLQREIATVVSEYYRSPQIVLTLLSPQSREELQLEFDNARREARERRSKSR